MYSGNKHAFILSKQTVNEPKVKRGGGRKSSCHADHCCLASWEQISTDNHHILIKHTENIRSHIRMLFHSDNCGSIRFIFLF